MFYISMNEIVNYCARGFRMGREAAFHRLWKEFCSFQ